MRDPASANCISEHWLILFGEKIFHSLERYLLVLREQFSVLLLGAYEFILQVRSNGLILIKKL